MAWFEVNLYSKALQKDTVFEVLMPDIKEIEGKKCPCLLLLHGKGDNQTKWLRRTSVERYAKKHKLAVIMPDARKSFYTNMMYGGGEYWQYISEEIPEKTRKIFPSLSDKREDNYVAGLSMGGYGALKIALHYPERYHRAASFSGGVNITKRAKINVNHGKAVFGDANYIPGSENDLYHLVSFAGQSRKLSELYLCCGTEDFLYEDNWDFHCFLKEKGVDHIYEEWKGVHDWDFWDEAIKRGIEFMMGGRN